MCVQVNVTVKWGKEKYPLELDTAGGPATFKAQLFALTGDAWSQTVVIYLPDACTRRARPQPVLGAQAQNLTGSRPGGNQAADRVHARSDCGEQ